MVRDTDFLQPDFSYSSPADSSGMVAGGLPVALSIFADRAHLRATIREDVQAAGLTVTAAGSLADILEGDRKSVVSGKSVSVRVGLGGSRIIQKTNQQRIKKTE